MKKLNYLPKLTALIASIAVSFGFSACDPDCDCSQKDIQDAIKTYCSVSGTKTTTYNEITFDYTINAASGSLSYAHVKIDKVDFLLDDEYYSSDNTAPYQVSAEKLQLEPGMHELKARIYARCAECNKSETQTEIIVWTNDFAGTVDYYLDYNFVGEGDTFTVTAHINEEKSPAGSYIKRISGSWGPHSMGERTSAPFTLSHVVTEAAGTERDVNIRLELSDGTSHIIKWYETVIPSTKGRMTNRILSNNNDFTQNQTLKCKAYIYKGKDASFTQSELKVYFDNKLIETTTSFPFYYSIPLKDYKPGVHTLKCHWKNTNGEEVIGESDTNETITIK
ncbi:MAG: hypothetical protein K2K82_04405 [Muribaculaceae bacterium]|nr:hypothetical protein [Muribaculaceae bacterium]